MKKIVLITMMTIGLGLTSVEADAQTAKKGKKAAIGAAAGAAAGVAVSKNNSKGAVIGGVIGAGSGYLYGRHKEKKAARKRIASRN